jgi:Arc/MetJ-type ribon-helix-helix transcriptional regulator
MQLTVPPDLETIINKRLSSGGYSSAMEVLRRDHQAQDLEESWTEGKRQAHAAHIDKGYLQAERGELTDADAARSEIQTMKEAWRLLRRRSWGASQLPIS